MLCLGPLLLQALVQLLTDPLPQSLFIHWVGGKRKRKRERDEPTDSNCFASSHKYFDITNRPNESESESEMITDVRNINHRKCFG